MHVPLWCFPVVAVLLSGGLVAVIWALCQRAELKEADAENAALRANLAVYETTVPAVVNRLLGACEDAERRMCGCDEN